MRRRNARRDCSGGRDRGLRRLGGRRLDLGRNRQRGGRRRRGGRYRFDRRRQNRLGDVSGRRDWLHGRCAETRLKRRDDWRRGRRFWTGCNRRWRFGQRRWSGSFDLRLTGVLRGRAQGRLWNDRFGDRRGGFRPWRRGWFGRPRRGNVCRLFGRAFFVRFAHRNTPIKKPKISRGLFAGDLHYASLWRIQERAASVSAPRA